MNKDLLFHVSKYLDDKILYNFCLSNKFIYNCSKKELKNRKKKKQIFVCAITFNLLRALSGFSPLSYKEEV